MKMNVEPQAKSRSIAGNKFKEWLTIKGYSSTTVATGIKATGYFYCIE
jgi:hypothetical protein